MPFETYLKFWNSCYITSFYFHYPEHPEWIPRIGDCVKPIAGEIFIPANAVQVKAAKAFAEEKWGFTIKRDGEHWRFVKC